MTVDPSIVARFAANGVLRACINLGNPVLAKMDPAGWRPVGVSVDLADAFAKRLGVPIELLAVDTAAQSVAALENARADIGFFAIDPKRGEQIAFTPPYVLIEGAYLVREGSPIQRNEDVDQPGRRVVVGQGSAYDLFLSRELQHAELVRVASSQAVVDSFVADQRIDVAAGVRQQLQADARRVGEVRLLDGRFMVIRQAMGVARQRGPEAASLLAAFVEAMKAEGFVAEALRRHGIDGASVAPAGS